MKNVITKKNSSQCFHQSFSFHFFRFEMKYEKAFNSRKSNFPRAHRRQK